MELYIPKEYGYDFVVQVLKKIQKDLLLKLQTQNFGTISSWIAVIYLLKNVIYCEDIILYSLDYLQIIELDNFYKITFDKNVRYPGTNIKLITLINTISFGTREFRGNKLIVNEFKQLNKILKILYKEYIRYGMIV